MRQHELARELANRLGADIRGRVRGQPSSDDPYRGGDDGKPPAAPPGKTGKPDEKEGRPARWQATRNERILALPADRDERGKFRTAPKACADCGATSVPDLRRCVGAHVKPRTFPRLHVSSGTAAKHVYFQPCVARAVATT